MPHWNYHNYFIQRDWLMKITGKLERDLGLRILAFKLTSMSISLLYGAKATNVQLGLYIWAENNIHVSFSNWLDWSTTSFLTISCLEIEHRSSETQRWHWQGMGCSMQGEAVPSVVLLPSQPRMCRPQIEYVADNADEWSMSFCWIAYIDPCWN